MRGIPNAPGGTVTIVSDGNVGTRRLCWFRPCRCPACERRAMRERHRRQLRGATLFFVALLLGELIAFAVQGL